MRWMRLRLHAPFASFGTTAIDAVGRSGAAPARSMLTGLFGNALGWDRTMRKELQELQDRMIAGALEDEDCREVTTDYQTAMIEASDAGWTTRGKAEGRGGSAQSYAGSHQRWREYDADLRMTAVIRLEKAERAPTLETLREALERPRRPLFIGRGSCFPSARLFAGWITAGPEAVSALRAAAPADGRPVRAWWPAGERTGSGVRELRRMETAERRVWSTDTHGGGDRLAEGVVRNGREAGR